MRLKASAGTGTQVVKMASNFEEAKPRTSFRLADLLIRVVSLLYLSIGLLKLHGLAFPADTMGVYLGLSNPIVFFLTNRVILAAAALVEVIVGLAGLNLKLPLNLRAGFLFWLCIVAFAYKIGLAIVDYKGPCGCLLGLNRFLPLSVGTQKSLADIILIVTVFVSLAVLIYCWSSANEWKNATGPRNTGAEL